MAERNAENNGNQVFEDDHQTELHCYTNPNHCSKTVEELSNKPKDCVINVEETNIEVHRSVMSLVSSYFEASVRFGKLTDKNEDSSQSTDHLLKIHVELDDVNAEAVRALVDYAYTGKIHLTKENAQGILKCTEYFCSESVSEDCVKFLSESLDYNKVNELLKIFKKIHDENFSMYKVIILFTAQNFSLFIQNKSYLDFDVDFLVEVLSDDKLVVMEELVCGDKTEFYFTTPARQEEIVLKCVIQYVQHVKDYSILPRLVKKCVRLGLISPEVRNNLQEQNSILNSSECSELFKIANEKLDASETDFSKWNKPRDLKDVLTISWSNGMGVELNIDENAIDEQTYTASWRKITNEEDLDEADRARIKILGGKKYLGIQKKYEYFDDSELLTESCAVVYVTGITTYGRLTRDCTSSEEHITGMAITYSNGVTVQHGSNHNYRGYRERSTKYEFICAEDERIVNVFTYLYGHRMFGFRRSTATTPPTYASKLSRAFDMCEHQTNTGRGFTDSGEDILKVSKPVPSACLAFVKGTTYGHGGQIVRDHLQFGWIYNKRMVSK